jgi:hypothetical protein
MTPSEPSHRSHQRLANLLPFSQTGAQVQALIAGSATGADRDISELLDAAGRSLEQAVESLQIAAQGCRNYADHI